MKKIALLLILSAMFFCGWRMQVLFASADVIQQDEIINIDLATANETQLETSQQVVDATIISSIRGELRWIELSSGEAYPLQNIKLDIYDATTNTKIHSVYSDSSGEYIYESHIQRNIYLKIKPGNDKITLKSEEGVEYYYTSDTISLTQVGQIFNWQIQMSSNLGKAFQISQAAIITCNYAETMSGESMPAVDIYYPVEDSDYYNYPSIYDEETGERVPLPEGRIYLDDSSYNQWDVITHEYAHHIGRILGLTNNPGGEHSWGGNLGAEYGKERASKLAWGEAVATVLGNMAQDYYSDDLKSDNGIKIPLVADGAHRNRLLDNTTYATSPYTLGELSEACLIEILWDIFDPINCADSRLTNGGSAEGEEDRFGIGHGLWNILFEAQAENFSDFVNYYTNGNRYITVARNLAPLLASMKITATDLTIDMSDESVVISWSGNGGNEYDVFNNNLFQLMFFGVSANVIYTIPNITATTYTLTQQQWQNVLYKYGTTFEVAVIAYQRFPSPVYITGGYMSDFIAATKPIYNQEFEVGFLSNFKYDEREITLTPGSCFDYKVTFQAGGSKVFQTMGEKDTVIEILQANGTVLSSDDDSGYNTNAFLRYYVVAYQEYTVRVKFWGGDYGTTKFVVLPAYTVRESDSEALESYEDIKSFTTSALSFKTYATNYYMKVIRFIPTSSAVYTIELSSVFDTCLYLLDPRSHKEYGFVGDEEELDIGGFYDDNSGVDLNASITVALEQNVEYLIIYGANDPSQEFTNLDEGDDIYLYITKQ